MIVDLLQVVPTHLHRTFKGRGVGGLSFHRPDLSESDKQSGLPAHISHGFPVPPLFVLYEEGLKRVCSV